MKSLFIICIITLVTSCSQQVVKVEKKRTLANEEIEVFEYTVPEFLINDSQLQKNKNGL